MADLKHDRARELIQDSFAMLNAYRDHLMGTDKNLIDDLEAYLNDTRNVSAPIQTGWQPIETAPLDKTYIIALVPNALNERDPNAVKAWFDDGWFSIGFSAIEPTHWMPLPAAPTPASLVDGETDNVPCGK